MGDDIDDDRKKEKRGPGDCVPAAIRSHANVCCYNCTIVQLLSVTGLNGDFR